MTSSTVPYRQIRADYDDKTITVYQAYKRSIADAAVKEQKIHASPDFRHGRMTWIKPSWCWMMYRSGYSYKDARQERILAIKMTHEHFIGLLEKGLLSSHTGKREVREGDKRARSAEVRVQWDPERTPKLEVLPYRSIQIGIPWNWSETWAKEWIYEIEDVTERARELKRVVDERPDITTEELIEMGLVPKERPFSVPESIVKNLDMTVQVREAEEESTI